MRRFDGRTKLEKSLGNLETLVKNLELIQVTKIRMWGGATCCSRIFRSSRACNSR